MRHLLEGEGFQVIEAEDGALAFEIFERAFVPALVIADIIMPNMNGLRFAAPFAAILDHVDIPIFFRQWRCASKTPSATPTKPAPTTSSSSRSTPSCWRIAFATCCAPPTPFAIYARASIRKLEALGTLAGGIAHDLNNTLVPIMALSKVTARQTAPGTKTRENLETIFRASQQARDMVKRILAFSRNDIAAREDIRLDAVVGEALKLLRAQLPPRSRSRPG